MCLFLSALTLKRINWNTAQQQYERVTHKLFSKPFMMDFRLVKVRIGIRANGSCQKE